MPGQLYICDALSHHVPPGRHWTDVGGRRHFAAAFYADLLRDLGISLAIISDEDRAAAPDAVAAFLSRGIRLISLSDLLAQAAAEPEQPSRGVRDDGSGTVSKLRELAAFAFLSGRAKGPVALLCPPTPAARSRACALAAAWIAARHRLFPSSEAAAAWAGLAAGGAPMPLAEDLAALRGVCGRRWAGSPQGQRPGAVPAGNGRRGRGCRAPRRRRRQPFRVTAVNG